MTFNKLKIEREWAMPNKWTFKIDPIERLLREEMTSGLWIDPFAGKSRKADVTNDINPEFDTDYNEDARDFLRRFEDEEVDGGVLFDPPYSLSQVARAYKILNKDYTERNQIDPTGGFPDVKDEVQRITMPQSKVVYFGWNTTGMGKERGFKKKRILIVCHGGNRNDTLCTVEEKIQKRLDFTRSDMEEK